MLVYIDTETIPGQAPWVRELTDATVAPPGNISKQATIDKWWSEKAPAAQDAAWRKTALDATLGELAVIAWATDDGEISSVSRSPEQPEGEFLQRFFDEFRASTHGDDDFDAEKWGGNRKYKFVGHNVLFDLGFLWKRSVINQIKIPFDIPYDAKPWSKEIIDTVQMWKGNSRDSASMTVLCKAFGIPYPDDMDGSKVWDEIQAGNLDKVTEYCQGDVDRVRQMYNRMMSA